MVTVEQFERGEVKLTQEYFEPIYQDDCWYGVPYKRIVGFRGVETGTVLHPNFSDILEHSADNLIYPTRASRLIATLTT